MDLSYKCKETGITGQDLFTLVDAAAHAKLSGYDAAKELIDEAAGYLKQYGKNWAEVAGYFTEHLAKCPECKKQIKSDADIHFVTIQVGKEHPEIWD
ncbi:MAG: hypothetical protein V1837_06875 [Candidatus Woesearchaeota archaeon]